MKPGGSRSIGAHRAVTFNLEKKRETRQLPCLGGKLKRIASGEVQSWRYGWWSPRSW